MSETGVHRMLDVNAWVDAGRSVVELAGELDMYSAERLRDVLDQLPEDAQRRVALEMSRLDFLDSSGLGVLIRAMKRAKMLGGGLCLVAVQERVLKTFRITGLLRVMPVFPVLDDAFTWLDGQRAAAR
jgi:anti-sigma B factor antagonist